MSMSDNQRQNQQKIVAQWREVEPTDRADPAQHVRTLQKSGAEGWVLLGASRRGKLHAHEGAYREDEFAFASANGWNFAAIADGAGSRPMARVGAKEACCGSAAGMARFVEDPANVFADHKEAFAKQCLFAGFTSALLNITAAAEARGIPTAAMSATLLLLAHRPAQSAHELDVIASAQIGDGLLIAIDYRIADKAAAEAYFTGTQPQTENRNFSSEKSETAEYSAFTTVTTDNTEIAGAAGISSAAPPNASVESADSATPTNSAAAHGAPQVLLPLAAADMGYYANETQFFPDLPQDEWESRMRFHELPPGAFLLLGMTDGVADDMFPITTYIPMLRDAIVPALQSANPETQLLDLISYDKRDSSDDRTLVVFYQSRFIAHAAARGKDGGNGK